MFSEVAIHSDFVTRYCVPDRTICQTPMAKDCNAIVWQPKQSEFLHQSLDLSKKLHFYKSCLLTYSHQLFQEMTTFNTLLYENFNF